VPRTAAHFRAPPQVIEKRKQHEARSRPPARTRSRYSAAAPSRASGVEALPPGSTLGSRLQQVAREPAPSLPQAAPPRKSPAHAKTLDLVKLWVNARAD